MIFNETKTHEITVDVVIVTMKNNALQVLLVKRNNRGFARRSYNTTSAFFKHSIPVPRLNKILLIAFINICIKCFICNNSA